ncbi:MAG: hypothetical protein V8T24_07990 [Roseburia hominis]
MAQTIQNIPPLEWILQKTGVVLLFFLSRPEECGWYGKEQISDWFSIREDERLHLGDVYLNAMGDDANSYIYYELVHLSWLTVPCDQCNKMECFSGQCGGACGGITFAVWHCRILYCGYKKTTFGVPAVRVLGGLPRI